MNDLARPALYDAYHDFVAVRPSGERMIANIAGPVCESGDTLRDGRDIDRVVSGDLAIFRTAGAYGATMASTYTAARSCPKCWSAATSSPSWLTGSRRRRSSPPSACPIGSPSEPEVSLHSLPIFVRLAGRAVILLGDGDAADAKRRLLERAGAEIVGENAQSALAIVAIDDETDALAAVSRLKARGILVIAVDRPSCALHRPRHRRSRARLIAIANGGASAGLAAALRQRLEALLPSTLGQLASDLSAARAAMRAAWPDGSDRRRALAAALAPSGPLDPLKSNSDVGLWLAHPVNQTIHQLELIRPRSPTPTTSPCARPAPCRWPTASIIPPPCPRPPRPRPRRC